MTSKPAGDTKLCGAADMPEEREAIQRDLHKPEKCTHGNLMRLNNGKHKVVCLCGANPWYQQRLRDEGTWEQPLGLLVDEKLDISQQRALAAQKANCIPGCIQRNMGSRLCSSPPHGWEPTWSTPSSSGIHSTGKTWNGFTRQSQGWLQDRLRELGFSRLEKKRVQGDLSILSVWTGCF